MEGQPRAALARWATGGQVPERRRRRLVGSQAARALLSASEGSLGEREGSWRARWVGRTGGCQAVLTMQRCKAQPQFDTSLPPHRASVPRAFVS